MNDEKYDASGSDGPEVEPTLLIRFVLKKFDELLERENPTMSVLYRALALAAVAQDETADSELQAIFFPESQVKCCSEVLRQALTRIQEGQFTECREAKLETDVSLPEWVSRQVLITALSESRKMLDENNFEYAKIIRSLAWIALQYYPRRLSEFQSVWKSSSDDPGVAIERGLEVLRIAFMSKDKECSRPTPERIEEPENCSRPSSLN